MFRLRLLGGASLEGPHGPLTGAVAQRQRLALLSLLALSPAGFTSRDKLLAVLWPETDSEKARHALSNALYMVRKELGEDAVEVRGDDLALNGSLVAVDALQFLAAVKEGRHEQAVELFLGPLLDGVHLKDAPEFEHWADGERDRFNRAYADTLQNLATKAQAEGEWRAAVGWWRKLAALDPFNAITATSLMAALNAAGSRAEAIQHAGIYTTLLKEELGAEPDPAVIRLAEDLRRQTGAPRETPPAGDGTGPETTLASGRRSSQEPTAAADRSSQEAAPASGDSPRPKPTPAPVQEETSGSPFRELVESPLVHWPVTYLAGAWFVLQAMEVLADPWGLSRDFQRGLTSLLFLGFPLAVAAAWFQSRREGRGVRRYRALVLAIILGTLGMGLAMLAGPDRAPSLLQGKILRASYSATDNARPLPSVAVLPFDNISPNPDDAYLADGLHEELITQLSKISGLIVISRGSVMGFRDHRLPTPEIARQLNVSAVLEGSIQKAGEVVRFTAQLIDGETDAHLWGESYDRALSVENLFEVQTEVSLRIAERLRATLTPSERGRIATLPTENLQAFELYLRGRQRHLQYQAEENAEAIQLYRQALALDPGFSLAWASLSGAYSQGVLGFGFGPNWSDSALAAARRSIELDPNQSQGHQALGLAFTAMGSYRPGLDAYMEALRFDPNNSAAAANVGVILLRFGALDESLLWTRRALQVSPTHALARANLAWNYLALEDWSFAEAWARGVIDDNPELAHAYQALAFIASARGDSPEGVRISEQIIEMDPDAPARRQFAAELALFARDWEKTERYSRDALSLTPGGGIPPWHLPATTLGFALLQRGEAEEAQLFLNQARQDVFELMEAGSEDPRLPWEMGCVLAAEGRSEEAIVWLERGYEEGWRWARVSELDPLLDPLRSDARFRAVLSGMNEAVASMRQRAREDEEAAGLR